MHAGLSPLLSGLRVNPSSGLGFNPTFSRRFRHAKIAQLSALGSRDVWKHTAPIVVGFSVACLPAAPPTRGHCRWHRKSAFGPLHQDFVVLLCGNAAVTFGEAGWKSHFQHEVTQ